MCCWIISPFYDETFDSPCGVSYRCQRWPCIYLARLMRYWGLKILRSRPWPFGVTWHHRSRVHLTPHEGFPVQFLTQISTLGGFFSGKIFISNFLTPKRHTIVWDRVVWAIACQNPPWGLTSRWVSEKKVYVNKKFWRIFHPFVKKPPLDRFAWNFAPGSPRRRNQLCQILSQSD